MPKVARLSRLASLIVLVLGVSRTQPLGAQYRFEIDSASSLAWWQIDPNFGYLWATTCPQDTNWYAGAAHSPGYRYRVDKDPVHGRPLDQKLMNATPIPVYPRGTAAKGCAPSVRGEIVASDTGSWRGTKGLILIRAANLVTGLNFRDDFARKRVLETDEFPDIRFVIDSLVNIKKGDTLEATAEGKLEIHGTSQARAIGIRAWREPLGLRVTGHITFPPKEMVSVYHIPLMPLGLGVGAGMWHLMYIGIDVVMVPSGRTSAMRLSD